MNTTKENSLADSSKSHAEANGEVADVAQKTTAKKAKKDDDDTPSISPFAVLRYADAQDIVFMIIGIVCTCAQGVGLPLLLLYYGRTIDLFIDHSTEQLMSFVDTNGTNSNSGISSTSTLDVVSPTLSNIENDMDVYVNIYAIIGVVAFVVALIATATWFRSADRQICRIRLAFFDAALRQEMAWWDSRSAGEINTIATQIDIIRDGINEKVPQFLKNIVQLVAAFAIAFSASWKLTLVLLTGAPVMIFCGGMMVRVTQKSQEKETQAYSLAGGIAKEALSAIKTVTAFNGQKKIFSRYSLHLSQMAGLTRKSILVRSTFSAIVDCMDFVISALAFWYGSRLVREDDDINGGGVMLVFICILVGSHLVQQNEMAFSNVYRVFSVITFGAMTVGQRAGALPDYNKGIAAAAKIFSILDRKSLVDPESSDGSKDGIKDGEVRFDNVEFSYITRPEQKVLQGLNLRIEPKQTVALVGESGSGKSTVISMLERFYDCSSGKRLLDGRDLPDYNVPYLRSRVSLVSQEPILFDVSIAENIAFGDNSRQVSTDEIISAAKKANMLDFIQSLPERFETRCGSGGTQLSGGQKQRICIARALVSNPSLLLLDEATSALDSESERVVQAALDEAQQDRTCVVVAHRLSTIRNANKICVVDKGKVIEEGTHAQLMDLKGKYYMLYMISSTGHT